MATGQVQGGPYTTWGWGIPPPRLLCWGPDHRHFQFHQSSARGGGDFLPAQLLHSVGSRLPRTLQVPSPTGGGRGEAVGADPPASPAWEQSWEPGGRPVPACVPVPAGSRDPWAEPPWHQVSLTRLQGFLGIRSHLSPEKSSPRTSEQLHLSPPHPSQRWTLMWVCPLPPPLRPPAWSPRRAAPLLTGQGLRLQQQQATPERPQSNGEDRKATGGPAPLPAQNAQAAGAWV